MSEKLLSCPFCNNEDVECDDVYVSCDCFGGYVEYNQWQERHYPPEVQAVIDAAKKYINYYHIYLESNTMLAEKAEALCDLEQTVKRFEEKG